MILVAEPVARSYARAIDMPSLSVYVLPWFRLDGFAVGALLAFAHRRGLLPLLDRWVPIVVIAGVAGIIVCTIMGGHTWWWNRWMQQYGYSLIAITGGAMLVSAINRPADSLWPRMLSAGWLRAFGKYSYGMYLIHAPVMRAVREYVFNPEEYEAAIAPWNAQMLFYGLATAPTFALAWLSWRLFEAPILRLKARFPFNVRARRRRRNYPCCRTALQKSRHFAVSFTASDPDGTSYSSSMAAGYACRSRFIVSRISLSGVSPVPHATFP